MLSSNLLSYFISTLAVRKILYFSRPFTLSIVLCQVTYVHFAVDFFAARIIFAMTNLKRHFAKEMRRTFFALTISFVWLCLSIFFNSCARCVYEISDWCYKRPLNIDLKFKKNKCLIENINSVHVTGIHLLLNSWNIL